MDDITIFNLRVVNKGALKATVSIRLGGVLSALRADFFVVDGTLTYYSKDSSTPQAHPS
jgi:hypothetical protein